MYFSEQEAVINIQAREHLAQAHRKNEEEKRNKNDKPRPETSSMAQIQEAYKKC
jgi:hypothetical protein